jgi:four helix bundle protein
MFDYEKLEVYKRAKSFHQDMNSLMLNHPLDSVVKDQLKRASLSVVLNIAEGTSRFSKADQKRFFVIARGSLFESVAILHVLNDAQKIDNNLFQAHYTFGDELSRMLFAYIKKMET